MKKKKKPIRIVKPYGYNLEVRCRISDKDIFCWFIKYIRLLEENEDVTLPWNSLIDAWKDYYSQEVSVESLWRMFEDFTSRYPSLAKIIQRKVAKDDYKGGCSFPFSCNDFPCERLSCNADCCSNGYAYRMS